ncbi:MAG: pilus assembly protein TadG-related protein [Terriglobales bacterium]
MQAVIQISKPRPRPATRQSGQAIVLGVAFLLVLMAIAALGADFGVARFQRSKLQIIADGAALSGTAELPYGDVTAGAQNDASLNGFVSGSNGATLTVNNPPLSGPHTGDSAYVEVIASQSQSTSFLNFFGFSTLNLTARAVGYLGSGPACLYALDPSASGAITLNGTFDVQLQCGMLADSDSSSGLLINGSGSLTASSIGVAGGALVNGTVSVNPTPVDGIIPEGDPLAYLDPPSTAGSCSPTTVINGPGNFVLSQGVYCSTVIINGSPNVTFSPGTYIFKSGIIMNGTPTLTGTGVTFYNASGSFTLNGSSTTNLSAPTTGPFAGILVFQSRTDSSQLTVNGSNTAIINGAIYASDATIVDNGSGTASAYTILVSNKITVNGSATLNDNYTTLPGGSPIHAAVLVE